MRLHPAVTIEEARAWLDAQARLAWGEDRLADLDENLQSLAEAMAAISAVELAADIEPLFP